MNGMLKEIEAMNEEILLKRMEQQNLKKRAKRISRRKCITHLLNMVGIN